MPALFAMPALAADNAKTQDDLQHLRDRIQALQQKLDTAEGAHKEAADDLRASERAISEANRKLRDLNAQQRDVNARLAKLQTQSQRTASDIETQQTQLARVLYEQYAGLQPDALRLLMSGEDPERIARDMVYLGYVARAHADLIRNLRANLTHLNELAQDAREQHDELASIQKEQQAQRQQLEKEQRARSQVLARTSKEIKQQRHEISTLKRNEERLSKLIEQIDETLKNERLPSFNNEAGNDNSPFAQLKGKLSLPVRGELRNRFGSPRESGMLWKGLFIAASGGQDVQSIAAGRVVFADWLRGFGNLLIVDHGNGYMSLYGNNETLYKQVGDTVSGGEAIAQVGNSGGNSDSGLYFEMRYRGKAFDPLDWVRLK